MCGVRPHVAAHGGDTKKACARAQTHAHTQRATSARCVRACPACGWFRLIWLAMCALGDWRAIDAESGKETERAAMICIYISNGTVKHVSHGGLVIIYSDVCCWTESPDLGKAFAFFWYIRSTDGVQSDVRHSQLHESPLKIIPDILFSMHLRQRWDFACIIVRFHAIIWVDIDEYLGRPPCGFVFIMLRSLFKFGFNAQYNGIVIKSNLTCLYNIVDIV